MTILIIILLLIAIPLVKALLISEEYTIEREVNINKSKQEVFDYIKLLKNADTYNKWVMTDPNVKKEYEGKDGTVGFVYSWDSTNKNVGKGEQEITNIIDGKSIDYEIRFIKPFEGMSNAQLTTTAASDKQTTVKWVFSGLRNYPMRIMHVLLNLKNALGKDLETSLGTLKYVLEKR